MKTMVTYLMLAGLGMLLSCTKESSPVPGKGDFLGTETITLPFEAKYVGRDQNFGTKSLSDCGPEYKHVSENADGSGSFVGVSTYHSDFCFRILDLLPGSSYITAANGDILYISYEGKTCVGLNVKDNDNSHPDEICCWQVPFTILGGTGMFEKATGGGTTDDYLSSVGNLFIHNWKGTLTLLKDNFK